MKFLKKIADWFRNLNKPKYEGVIEAPTSDIAPEPPTPQPKTPTEIYDEIIKKTGRNRDGTYQS